MNIATILFSVIESNISPGWILYFVLQNTDPGECFKINTKQNIHTRFVANEGLLEPIPVHTGQI